MKLIVYGTKKKQIEADAQIAAIRIALFDGCPATPYSKPLLQDGEVTAFEQHPAYFDGLYNHRRNDFIHKTQALSDFKKANKQKGTAFEVELKVQNLRRDLEKNKIKIMMGL